jgi:hypothetical protein
MMQPDFTKAPSLIYGPDPASGQSKSAAHRFRMRHALSVYRRDAIYTYIPKNACTTLRYSISLDNGIINNDESFEYISDVNVLTQALLRDVLTARYRFVFLRCPFRRLSSVFLDKALSERYRFLYLMYHVDRDAGVLEKTRKAIARRMVNRLRGNALNLSRFTFRDFIRRLHVRGATMTNHHWAPQSSFLLFDEYDDYFSVERAGQGFEALTSRTGLRIIDARRLSRHGTDSLEQVDDRLYADTPVSDLAAMRAVGRVPAHRAMYDDELIGLVRQIYRHDLALYRDRCGPEDLLFPVG